VVVAATRTAHIFLFGVQQLMKQRPENLPVLTLFEMVLTNRDLVPQPQSVSTLAVVTSVISPEMFDHDNGRACLEIKLQNESVCPNVEIFDYRVELPVIDLLLVLPKLDIDVFRKSCHFAFTQQDNEEASLPAYVMGARLI